MGRKAKLPDDVRLLDSGRYGLQFIVDGRRLSGHSILRTEPRSYTTLEEALAGRAKVRAFLAANVDRHATVLGFWKRWSDEDHPIHGTDATGREADTFTVYRSRTRLFVERFGDRQIATITDADIKDHLNHGGKASQLATISMFFRDAIKDGLLTEDPVAERARDAKHKATKRRRDDKRRNRPPQRPAVDALLTRAAEGAYPRPWYGWLLTGVRTGMRGGEIDGMRWEYLDGDVYHIQQQLHYRSNTLTDPKHGSFRDVLLPADLMEEIDRAREARAHTPSHGSEFIWTNSYGDPWRQDARERWWHWCTDGGPALRSIVGGATMYQATRHHWADYALNVLQMHVPLIAKLYGHQDDGKTLLEYYARPDNDAALEALRTAHAAQPTDLSARRRRAA